MGRNVTIIPKAPVARIIFNAGGKRVSADAAETFTEILSEIAEEIATQAVKIAKHSGR